ncbi:hypothetical protein AB0B92_13825 [Streptomyces hygroscopicus]|uniref:hypothetical protein n=1 Tax=Streptomyces hygroscopicus TaxID=1912 RepID=UPI0033C0BF46
MAEIKQWHASPRRGASVTSDSGTGEVRVPLSLFRLDRHQGDLELVLARPQAEALQSSLALLTTGHPVSVAAAR